MVISIIAALASLLMTSLGLARASARSSVCSGSLRQLGVGEVAYAGDNEGVVPYTCDDRAGASFNLWIHAMRMVLDETVPDSSRRRVTYGGCPEYRIGGATYTSGYGANVSLYEPDLRPAAGRYANYWGPNAHFFGTSRDFHLSQIGSQANRLLICDSNCVWASAWWTDAVTARHRGGRVNAVFVDGHVASMTYDQANAAISAP